MYDNFPWHNTAGKLQNNETNHHKRSIAADTRQPWIISNFHELTNVNMHFIHHS